VAYRTGSRQPLDTGAAGKAILAGHRGDYTAVSTAGELQAGAYGVAAAIAGVVGLEASVGVVVLAALDAASVPTHVTAAATTVAAASI
jgi:hypothetical protein